LGIVLIKLERNEIGIPRAVVFLLSTTLLCL